MNKHIDHFLILLENFPYLKTFLLSLLLLLFATVFKKLFSLNLSKKKVDRTEKIFLQKKVNQYTNYLFLLLLFVLWFSQLQVVLVSLVAVAAAVVIATKEIIMCVMGGIYLRQNRLFKEGHRIEVDDVRGYVIERLFLTTKVLEIGPEKNSQQTTGEVIAIPNSIFLTKAVKNESSFKGYSIKSFQFRLNIEDDIEEFEKEILEKSNEICAEYLEAAKNCISSFCEKEGIIIPSVNPRTKVLFEAEEKTEGMVVVLLKIPVENSRIAELEQILIRHFLTWKKEAIKKRQLLLTTSVETEQRLK